MRYLTFATPEPAAFETCFLVPYLNQRDMRRSYVDAHLSDQANRLLAYDLVKHPKRTPVADQRHYLSEMLPVLKDLGVEYLVVCDAEYFKTLTKQPKADNAIGYVYDSASITDPDGHRDPIPEGAFKVIYCPNFKAVFYDPGKVNEQIRQSLQALKDHQAGSYIDPGLEVIKFAAYPRTTTEIRDWLQRLLDMECDLSADIETFSLKHHTAGIGTISLAWSKHEGIAFCCDYKTIPGATQAPYGENVFNPEVRQLLRDFFIAYHASGRTMRWHNISFDVYVLIYQLFMKDLLDTEGLLYGMEILLSHWDCTKLITYLATNSCAGNKLGLKTQALEFVGNYAVDEIKNICNIPEDQLLEYNLADTLATWFVYEKHWKTVVQDDQEDIYREIFQPAILDIVQMQLTGLPIDLDRVREVRDVLQVISDDAVSRMRTNSHVGSLIYTLNIRWVAKRNQELKVKRVSLLDAKEKFNPNSSPQLQELIFDEAFLGLPVLETTKEGNPKTGGDVLEALKNHTQDPDALEFLDALIEYKAVDKILSSFIPAFLKAPLAPDGCHYLFGNFNLGGTVSGRLSSSDPNLQNLPSIVMMFLSAAVLGQFGDFLAPYIKKGTLSLGKLVKSCFKAPPGWLFVGLDFDSLEDKISALTTRDPNKLKVYTDGFDGHCMRAQSYFGNQMPDIDPNSVESVNAIKTKYPDLRQDSKGPTFLLTYGGTHHGIVSQFNIPLDKAIQIETRYHELYRVSDAWVAARIAEAGQTGYVTGAFGLRLRTPLLRQVILGTSRTPYEAQAEGRTAGNALGQSWCLLNSRAGSELMGRVRSSKYRLDIRPCAQIHDAGYVLIRDDMDVLLYTNHHYSEAVRWQDHPDIAHDQVKLSGQLGIFFPSWAEEMPIPNKTDAEEIKALAQKHHAKHCS